ncbi:unnamed protein product, partial [Prorocentrum cordatum]
RRTTAATSAAVMARRPPGSGALWAPAGHRPRRSDRSRRAAPARRARSTMVFARPSSAPSRRAPAATGPERRAPASAQPQRPASARAGGRPRPQSAGGGRPTDPHGVSLLGGAAAPPRPGWGAPAPASPTSSGVLRSSFARSSFASSSFLERLPASLSWGGAGAPEGGSGQQGGTVPAAVSAQLRRMCRGMREPFFAVETCHNCESHIWNTRHCQRRYDERFQAFQSTVKEHQSMFDACQCVQLHMPGPRGLQGPPTNRYGAFEVYLVDPSEPEKPKVVHSKLQTRKWPNPLALASGRGSSSVSVVGQFDVPYDRVRSESSRHFLSFRKHVVEGLSKLLFDSAQMPVAMVEVASPLLSSFGTWEESRGGAKDPDAKTTVFAAIEIFGVEGEEHVDRLMRLFQEQHPDLLQLPQLDKLVWLGRGTTGDPRTDLEEARLLLARPSKGEMRSFTPFLLEPAREEAFKKAAATMQVKNLLGGMDAKAREIVANTPAQESLLTLAKSFVWEVEDMWWAKGCKGTRSVLDELQDNLREPNDGRNKNLTSEFVMRLSVEAEEKHGLMEGLDYRLRCAPFGLQVIIWYTMQEVDVDRIHLYQDVPEFPHGRETPAERDEVYKPYRELVKKDPGQLRRNPMMFGDANWAVRTSWDRYVAAGGQRDAHECWDGMQEWVRWVCLLGALRQRQSPPRTVSRGLFLGRAPEGVLAGLLDKQPGDLIFWAALSRTTTDPNIASHYANQAEPVEKNIVFTIENVYEGIHLEPFSQYPRERELLLAPFSLLRVKQVVQPSAGQFARLICDYAGTLMTGSLHDASLQEDLFSSWIKLCETGFACLEKGRKRQEDEERKRKEQEERKRKEQKERKRKEQEEAERKSKADEQSKAKADKMKAKTQEMLQKLGKGGSVQFFRLSLVWKKAVDLGLHLIGPPGQCLFNNKKCGPFELDVDDQGSGSTEDRIKNITANAKLGDGRYLAEVQLYAGSGPVDWEAVCCFGDGQSIYKAGTCSSTGQTCTIAEFDVTAGKPVLKGQ